MMTTEKVKEPTSIFAIQLMPKEGSQDVAELVCRTANEKKLLFIKLELLDVMKLGTTEFVRFRADLKDAEPILSEMQAQNRAIIRVTSKGYQATIGTRVASVPFSLMQVIGVNGPLRTYRGPKVQYWERQFLKEAPKG